ncbi:MAG: uracil-DNA glycosylase [Candidatus Nitrotoga sp.]
MNREELILREFNLYPLWRLRGQVAPAFTEVAGKATQRIAEPENNHTGNIEELSWLQLKSTVQNCTACSLRAGCTQPILGAGGEQADWLIIGDVPGVEEDIQNALFVGQAGILLDNMLAAIKLKRGNNVYLANLIKCHPLDGRPTAAAEIAQCLPYLERQITLIQPKLIVVLGKLAAFALLGSNTAANTLRGRVHDYHGIPLIVTYHPDYLLGAPLEKAKSWQDLRLAISTMRGAGEV